MAIKAGMAEPRVATKRSTPCVSATPDVWSLVQDDEVAVEMLARAIATAWRSPPDSEPMGWPAECSLPMPTSSRIAADFFHQRMVHAVEERGP